MFANVAQTLVTRFGVRSVLTAGLLLTAAAEGLLTQLPLQGHYFWNMFPAFLLSGLGLALSFIPMTIAGLTGVRGADAGVASGLINASRQIGGAVGLAAVSTIAAAYTANDGTVNTSLADGELTNGFDVAFWVLTGLAIVGALVAAALLAPQPRTAQVEPFAAEAIEPVEEAA